MYGSIFLHGVRNGISITLGYNAVTFSLGIIAGSTLRWHRICILLVLLSSMTVARADKRKSALHPFATSQTMPSGQVHQVYEDREGVIWLATFRGLVRYAEGSLRIFRSNLYTPEQLPCNNVICVCEDMRQRLWIGTENGLCLLDKRTGRIVQIPLPNKKYLRVNDLLVTRNGNVFAGMIRGLIQYDEAKNQMVEAGLDDVNIQSLAEMPNGDILIGTWGKGLYKHSIKQEIEQMPLPDAIASKTILDLHYDNNNRLWIGTLNEGLCQITTYKDKKWKIAVQYTGNDILSNCVYNIAESNGHLYSATRKGLFVDNNTNILPEEEVLGVCIDRSGCVWAATKGTGVYTTSTSNGNLADATDHSYQTLTDHDGNHWEAHNYGVKYQSILYSQSIMLLPSLRPYRLSLTNNGQVLIPMHDAGLYVAYRGKIKSHYSRKGGDGFIPHDLVHHAIEDTKGNLWVATRLGLGVRCHDGHGYVVSETPDAPEFMSEEMYFLTEDREGTIWAATDNGIIRCDSGNVYRRYSVKDRNFPIGTPTTFYHDKAGRRWVGTDGMGLCMYNSNKDCFMSVHEQLQLPSDIVTEVTEDSNGNLLVNTGTEVIRLSPQELTDMHRFPQSGEFKYWQGLLSVLAVTICAAIALRIYKRQRRPELSTAPQKQTAKSEKPIGKELPATITTIVNNPYQQFINKATDTIKRHLADYDFDVPQLANELSVSRTTLHRRMKKATGQTTTSFIRNIRLQAACQILLSSPGIRVNELAYQVGFNDPKYFSRCFKDTYGVQPGDYITENNVAK